MTAPEEPTLTVMVTDHVTDSPHLADRPDALRLRPTRLCRPMGHGRRHRVAVPSHQNWTGTGADLRHRGRPAHTDPSRHGRHRSGDRGRFRRGRSPQGTLGPDFTVSRPSLVHTNTPWCGRLRPSTLRLRATPSPRRSSQPLALPSTSTDRARTALTQAATPEARSPTGSGHPLRNPSPTRHNRPPTLEIDPGTRHRRAAPTPQFHNSGGGSPAPTSHTRNSG